MNKLVCLIPALCITACATTPRAGAGPSAPLINSAGRAIGTVVASQATEGVAFRIHATGLPPGVHGIHVHPIGRCDPPDFSTAGTHWNPTNKQHGLNNPNGPHAGDMPNVTVDANGAIDATVVLPHANMAQLLDTDGSSVMIHANADDYVSQPAGNSGAKIACAVIGPPAK